ncbi:hypothetical protein [Lysobacter brunescens]|uniref:Uncharacterized protein n=1 Tax=Lysobacter brunescens TaxID=262323 RepID=A0ABW2YE05_9GAMM
MTIDRLSSLSAQFAALRAELAKKSGEARRRPRMEDAEEASSTTGTSRPDSQSLRRQLATLVQGVDVGDAVAVNHVRPKVVKAILLWEFGASLREHAEWQPMIDAIAHALERDERFIHVFNQLIEELQS